MIYKEVFLLLMIFTSSACQTSMAENSNSTLPQSSPANSPTPSLSPTPTTNENTAISKIDFKNFTYAGPDDYPETFILEDGKQGYVPDKEGRIEEGYSLQEVAFSDLTGDGVEEAIITISIQTGGSAVPHLVFVYMLENNKPQMLWRFVTGDRAEGGLKDIYGDNGKLVVELFGETRFVNGNWVSDIPSGKFKGLCCPTLYTKTRFKWNGKQFVGEGTPEIFDIEQK